MSPPYGLVDLLIPLLKGAVVTLQVTALAAVVAFFLSFLAGFGRLSRFRLVRLLTSIYVEVFRGSSLLVQLFWMFYVLPFFGIRLSSMVVGVLGLGLNLGAYGSEVVRSSILAVPRGQTEAAIALNMTPLQRMRRIILPQAFLMMLPPFGNLLIELMKSTALVSLIILSDATFQAMKLRTVVLADVKIFSLLLLVYFAMTYPLTLGTQWLERKVSRGGVTR